MLVIYLKFSVNWLCKKLGEISIFFLNSLLHFSCHANVWNRWTKQNQIIYHQFSLVWIWIFFYWKQKSIEPTKFDWFGDFIHLKLVQTKPWAPLLLAIKKILNYFNWVSLGYPPSTTTTNLFIATARTKP